MKQPTLVGQLSRWHMLVTTATCLLLVAGALGLSALLLRRNQDRMLRSLGSTACGGVSEEQIEHPEMSLDGAAAEFFSEAAVTGYRVEFWDGATHPAAAGGTFPGWPATGFVSGSAGECVTLVGEVFSGGVTVFRSCHQACPAGFWIRTAAPHVLHEKPVRQAGLALLILLPVAVAFGGLAGHAVFRRLLQPLDTLRRAAADLQPAPGITLGVDARFKELIDLEIAFDGLLHRLGQSLESEKRFTQEAPHELRTPLTTLRLKLEELRDRVGPDHPARARAEEAITDVDSLSQLTAALLVLARSESAEIPLATVNLCDLARDGARESRTTPSPKVEAPDEILVRGNEELLGRALGNLLENANKFAGDTARIRIRAYRENGWAVLAVDDDGPGIPESARPQVLERFFREPGQRVQTKGTGLGLAVVKAVARRHGGDVMVGSGDLGGAAIRIRLPLL